MILRNFQVATRQWLISSLSFLSFISFQSGHCQPSTTQYYLPSSTQPPHTPSGGRQRFSALVESVNSFRDKSLSPSSSTRLSLIDCVQTALTQNPELLSAVASVQQSGLLFTASRNSWNPTFSLYSSSLPRYEYRRTYSDQTDLTPATRESRSPSTVDTHSLDKISTRSATFDASLDWRFLDFSRQASINNYAMQYDAQKYVLVSTIRLLISNIQTLYVDLQAQRTLVDSYSEIVDTLLRNVAYYSVRQKAGLASTLDVSQSESQLYNSLTQLVSAIQGYNEASDRLAAFIALPSGKLVLPTDQLSYGDEWKLSLQSTIDSAVNNNDAIRETLLLASASKWQGIYYLNQTLPQFSISLGATYSPASSSSQRTLYAGRTYAASPSTGSSIWQESSNLFAFLGFSWNVFQGGVNTSNAASQFAQSESYMYNVENQRNQLRASVQSNYSALEASRLVLHSSEEAIRSSYDAYRAAQARATVGLADVTTINQTIQSYQAAIQSRTTALQRYNTALALLYKDTAIWPERFEPFALAFLRQNSY